jgi:hypothetical protein
VSLADVALHFVSVKPTQQNKSTLVENIETLKTLKKICIVRKGYLSSRQQADEQFKETQTNGFLKEENMNLSQC